jgi:ribosome-binding factor A
MTTRNVPKLIFEIDNTLNNVSRINELIQKVKSDE